MAADKIIKAAPTDNTIFSAILLPL